ncbi:MAG: UUP1 family membrane protein, partial [Porticoccaceae bacterium]
MFSTRIQVILVASGLIGLGLGLCLYKAINLGFPLLPGEYRDVWTLESKINFEPSAKAPVEVELRLPEMLTGWTAADEYFASSGFGFTVIDGSTEITESSESGVIYTDRRARWTRQQLERPTTLYYKLQAYRSVERLALPDIAPPAVRPPLLEEDQLAALERLVAKLAAVSSGPESFTGLLIQEINNQSPDQDSLFLLSSYSEDPVILMLDVLAYQGISASRVRGIMLEDGRRRQTLSSLIEIHTADGSIVFNPRSAATGLPDNFFIWQRGDNAILNVIGGRNSSLEFAMVSNRLPVKTLIGMGQGSTEIDL